VSGKHGFKPRDHSFLAVWPWANYLTFYRLELLSEARVAFIPVGLDKDSDSTNSKLLVK
jgi:hypothetical protein